MTEPPQVQSIISSFDISSGEAKAFISQFLASQKNYFSSSLEVEVPSNGDDEEYFDLDDNNNGGTFEEIQSRLETIVRSLTGIKQIKSESSIVHDPHSDAQSEGQTSHVVLEERSSGKKRKKDTKKASKKKRKKKSDDHSDSKE